MRRLVRPKISWPVLYLKAYALVAEQNPVLNQMYVRFPFPHLYQHDSVVAMMTISREYRGEQRLFFARFNDPQHYSLASLQEQYTRFRDEPVESIRQFRHQIAFAKCPSLIRKLGWWTMFNLWPSKRASHVGTIGISFSAYRGIYGNRSLGPLTTVLGVDPMPRKGIGKLMLTFDHRVLDGMPACLILEKIQKNVASSIRSELGQMLGKSTSISTGPQTSPATVPADIRPANAAHDRAVDIQAA